MHPRHTVYRERRARFTTEVARLGRRSDRISTARLASFLLGVALLFGYRVAPAVPGFVWPAAAGVCFAGFVGLVVFYDRVSRARRRAEEGERINAEALHRLAREWSSVPEPRLRLGELPSFARDLDLFGHASLYQLLGTASTPLGKATLAAWLLTPAPPEEVRSRQEAVRELAPQLDFRQELQLRVRTMEKRDPDCEPFLRWAEGEPWLAQRPFWRWLARLLPVPGLILFGLFLSGVFPNLLWLLVWLANLGVAYTVGLRVQEVFDRIASREGELLEYARALELLAGDAGAAVAPRLERLRRQLRVDGLAAPAQMARLHRLVALSDVRFSGSLHLPLQAVLLLDFHVLDRLEAWQRRAGRAVRGWLAALGEAEALAALAGLAYDEPEWCFPELVTAADPAACRLVGRGLGHPLIRGAARVTNDVEVGPPDTFLLVTGSNMSGKSTLIRALGVNVVLAQAGGPACAEELRLPPVELGTSVLIEDSLEDGVSFFMAELRRLKEIVDRAAAGREHGRTLLYLLDEILRGTNSFERQIAVRRVLLHLLRQGAIGVISTHDLALAEIDELAAACRPVHFRETLDSAPGRPVMTFDYRLRPGVATTRNALKLLQLVGLELAEEGSA